MFYNIGTLTAYNIKIKNDNKEYFYYPENYKEYEEIVKLFYKIDNIADEAIRNELTNIKEIQFSNIVKIFIQIIYKFDLFIIFKLIETNR